MFFRSMDRVDAIGSRLANHKVLLRFMTSDWRTNHGMLEDRGWMLS